MTYTKNHNHPDFVNITDLMTELKTRKIPHKDFLKTYKAKAAFIVPAGRGYAHYVDKDTAEKIRRAFGKQQPTKVASKNIHEKPDPLIGILSELRQINSRINDLQNIWK